jgi:hypothetical protein
MDTDGASPLRAVHACTTRCRSDTKRAAAHAPHVSHTRCTSDVPPTPPSTSLPHWPASSAPSRTTTTRRASTCSTSDGLPASGAPSRLTPTSSLTRGGSSSDRIAAPLHSGRGFQTVGRGRRPPCRASGAAHAADGSAPLLPRHSTASYASPSVGSYRAAVNTCIASSSVSSVDGAVMRHAATMASCVSPTRTLLDCAVAMQCGTAMRHTASAAASTVWGKWRLLHARVEGKGRMPVRCGESRPWCRVRACLLTVRLHCKCSAGGRVEGVTVRRASCKLLRHSRTKQMCQKRRRASGGAARAGERAHPRPRNATHSKSAL